MTETALPNATKPRPPRTIMVAVGALVVSAVSGVLAAAAQWNDTFRDWAFDNIKSTDLKNSQAAKNPTKMPTDAEIHSTVNQIVHSYLLMAIVGGLLMFGIAAAMRVGKYWTRWATIGVWVLSTLVGGISGLSSLLGIGNDSPVPFRLLGFLSSLALIVALVLANLRPSVAFLARNRPVRQPGRGGGLFAPRARPSARTAPAPQSDEDVTSQPATGGKSRGSGAPADEAPSRPRTKSKPRVDVTATPSPDRGAARPRGKSRKTST